MAASRLSSLLPRYLFAAYYGSSKLPSALGDRGSRERLINPFCTAAAVEEALIIPPIDIKYTKLFINGEFVDAASRWADKIHGLTVPADGPYQMKIMHEPIGVCGMILPWNFPLTLYTWKVAPALICGNPVVLKTAEQTPLSALLITKLLHEAGLPPGVLNIISGYGPTTGAALASHMEVDKLSFTGSIDTGKTVLELAGSRNLKPVTLELGGKSPFIICEDANINKAVELAHFALFYNQGQCCCAGSRTYFHEKVYDELVEKAKARAMRRKVGDPFRANVEQGPQDDMPIAQDKIFGPVQSILKWRDLDDVVRRANNTRYGLAAGVFTRDLNTANTLSRAFRVGTVWINCYNMFDAAVPLAGTR